MKRIIKPLIQLNKQVKDLVVETRQVKKDLNKKINFIYARLSEMGIDKAKEILDEEEEYSADYPIGGNVEPYDIERDKKLTE